MTTVFAFIDLRPRLLLPAIFFLALSLRLGWACTRPTDDASLDRLPDQREYLDLGRSLLKDGSLAMGDARFNDIVRAFRMPGYPAFVAACGGNVRAIVVVQAIVDSATVLATFCLARRWFSPRLASLGAIIVAFDPLHVSFAGLVLSETVFAALLMWGMACLARGSSPRIVATVRAHLLWTLGVALLIGSIYFRPSAVAFPLVLVFVAALVETRSSPFLIYRRRVPVLACIALATFLALLPWAIRNEDAVGGFLVTTTNDGFTLYDGLNPDADGSSDQSWVSQLPLLPNLTEAQRSDYLRAKAIQFVRAQPARVIAMIPEKLARVWSPWPLSKEFGSWRNVLVAAGHAVPLFVLAITGLFNAGVPRTVRLFLLTPAILITLMHGLTVGSLRYRMPAEATLAVLAAAAFHARGRVAVDSSSLVPSPGTPGEG